jgi:hypothetical protein
MRRDVGACQPKLEPPPIHPIVSPFSTRLHHPTQCNTREEKTFHFPMTQVPPPAYSSRARPAGTPSHSIWAGSRTPSFRPARRFGRTVGTPSTGWTMRSWAPACLPASVSTPTRSAPLTVAPLARSETYRARKGSVVGSDRGQARILHCPALGRANGLWILRGGAIHPGMCLGCQNG